MKAESSPIREMSSTLFMTQNTHQSLVEDEDLIYLEEIRKRILAFQPQPTATSLTADG